MKRNILKLFVFASILALVFSLLPSQLLQALAISPNVVISQVFGGGGNAGATFKNDFIELFNLGGAPVDLTGWTVQYASSAGTSWSKTILTGTIQAGGYYLIQEAAGTGGTVSLPTPDVTGSIAMSATAAKVALVNNSTTLTGACPTGLVDFVGYGGANCSEGSPTPVLSNTTAALRNGNGCTDTDSNSGDFTVGAPNPRNSASPLNFCTASTNPTGIGNANPASLFVGDPTLLTVTVTPGNSPVSTGLAVSADLSAIGGANPQTFYNDGTNGDVSAGDNIFSLSATVAPGTTPGAKTIPATITDAQSRTGSATIGLTVTAILPIGTVNGPVLDADDGTLHVSPYAGQTVTIRGVIYEKTLQAISNSSNTYKGFFIQNTAATADTDPNTSDGLFVFMSTASTLSGPGGSPYTPAVGDEIILSGKISEYYNMTELTAPFQVLQVLRSGVNLEAELPPAIANPPVSLADANRYWERLQGMRVQVPVDSIVLGGRNVFSPADAEIWVANPNSTIALRSDPYARKAFRDAHPLDDNYDPTTWMAMVTAS